MIGYYICRYLLGVILLVLTNLLVINGDNIPMTIKRCKNEDKKCIATSMSEIIKIAGSSTGIPEIGLKQINPYQLPKINIDRGEGSPVVLKILLKNAIVKGLDCFVIDNVNGFDRNPKKSIFEIIGRCDTVSITGPYKMSGRFLLFPVTGQGFSNITFVNNNFTMTWHTDVDTRNGEDYLKIKKVDYHSNTKRFVMNMDNLFNNKALSDNMNTIFNENHQLIFKEVQPSIEHTFENILRDIIQPVFDKFPYKYLFLE